MTELIEPQALLQAGQEFAFRGKTFRPCISASAALYDPSLGFNAARIALDISPESTLKWEESAAQEIAASGGFLFWELNLGDYPFEPLILKTLQIGVNTFLGTLFDRYKEMTLGVMINLGNAASSSYFPWTEEMKELYLLWKEEEKIPKELSETHAANLFSIGLRSQYMHSLCVPFPLDFYPFVFFDVTGISSAAKQAQLFSQRRFPHLYLGLRGASVPLFGLNWEVGKAYGGFLGRMPIQQNIAPQAIALCLPEDSKCCESNLNRFDALLEMLAARSITPRVIYEDHLNEQWDELDQILVLDAAMDEALFRKLLGFCAAGGEVITEEKNFGFPQERSLSKFLN